MIDCQTVRELALALPEAEEHDHFGRPSFRVRGKIFATLWPAENRAMVKLDREGQRELIRENPNAISAVPGTWGERGCTFISLGQVSREDMTDLLKTAWTRAAPKKLVAEQA